MKKFFSIGALALVVGFLSTSCEEVDDLKVIEIDTGVEASMNIDIQHVGDTTIKGQDAIDVFANPDLADYQNRIENLRVAKLEYKVENFTGTDSAAFEGTLVFESLPQLSLELPYTNVKEAQETQTITTIQTTADELDQISALFTAGGQIKYEIDGTAYNAPMKFDLKLIGTVNAEARITE